MMVFGLAGRPWAQEALEEGVLVAGVSRNAAGMRDWKLSRRLRDQRSAYKMNCQGERLGRASPTHHF